MDELTLKKRLQVVDLYFCGLSSDQIAAKTNISKGSVANIVTELKAGNFPEAADVTDQIESLREIAVNLNKLKLTVGKAVVGIALLSRIYALNLDPSDMERWPLLLNSVKGQDDANEIIGAAYTVRDIQKQSGMTLSAIEEYIKQLGEKTKELEITIAKIEATKTEMKNLAVKKDELTTEVNSLEYKFNWLTPRVQELENRESGLLNRHKTMLNEESKAKTTIATLSTQLKKLQKTGLSVDGLVDFNRKLEVIARHHGIKPAAVRERLLRELKHLNKAIGLDTVVKDQQQTLKTTKQAVLKCKSDIASLETVLANLTQRKQDLEASIKEVTACVRFEIEHIVPVAQDTVKQITENLKNGCAEVLSEVHQLKEQSIQIGQDVGQYQNLLKESDWVNKLTELVRGGNNVDATDIRTIAILVNRGISAWLGQNQTKSPDTGLLAINAAKFVAELERWQTQG